MGALKGTLTYTTYYVLEEPPAGFREPFLEALNAGRFRDIDVEAGKDRAMGWTLIDDIFSEELSWDRVFVDPYVCLCLREDAIRIPPTVFKAHLGRQTREYLNAQGKDNLAKSEKANLKAMVLAELRRRALPDIKSYDVVWNTAQGVMRLWTHNKRVREVFEDIVRDQWGLRVVPQSPYTAALADRSDPESGARLLDIDPADLVGIGA